MKFCDKLDKVRKEDYDKIYVIKFTLKKFY